MISVVVFLLIAFVPAAIGALFPAPGYYAELSKPDWAPPDWLFGPVWTALYVLIGLAAWLVWRTVGLHRWAHGLWLVQLVLNAAWTPLFFGLQEPVVALVGIAALWLAIVATIVAFWRIRPLAGAILLPYLAWVSFATALNFEIWRLNPGG
jgi:benzodiazapine receptor